VPHNSPESIISRRAVNHNGRISPYWAADDALCGTARFLIERGEYRRGEAWGYEVKLPVAGASSRGGGTDGAQAHPLNSPRQESPSTLNCALC
jgi:membrane-bound lytic murein transglycosylase B